MRLVDKSGKTIELGDGLRTFRGERAVFHGIEQPPSPGKSGKIRVSIDGDAVRTVYPGVCGLAFESDGDEVAGTSPAMENET